MSSQPPPNPSHDDGPLPILGKRRSVDVDGDVDGDEFYDVEGESTQVYDGGSDETSQTTAEERRLLVEKACYKHIPLYRKGDVEINEYYTGACTSMRGKVEIFPRETMFAGYKVGKEVKSMMQKYGVKCIPRPRKDFSGGEDQFFISQEDYARLIAALQKEQQ